jgi:Arc/MetJ-type ribon-helix-helix transcriptional regulator
MYRLSGMKINRVHVSLTAAMSEFVRENVARDYDNVSEFFRDLLRERMRREIKNDLAFLNNTTEGAPAGPSEEEITQILAVQRKVRKDMGR